MIEFRSVTKTFADGTTAVDDFSLTIPSRTTTVLVGSSGCGKTTLLRMVNRMVEPSSGSVAIDGEDIAGVDPVALRRRIGYVIQGSGLLPHRTVLQNVAVVPLLAGWSKPRAQRRAMELIELVGLDPKLAARYPVQLSGGQQQRVGVARGLAADPNILLMDEPFGAVDPVVREELQNELLRIQRELAKTIVFITHDVEEAFLLGDEVVILTTGAHVAQQGTPASIMAAPADDFVSSFIGANRRDRRLSVESRNGVELVVDERGRPVGTLSATDRTLSTRKPVGTLSGEEQP